MKSPLVVCVLVLAACSHKFSTAPSAPPPSAPAAQSAKTLRWDGYGPIRFGMPLSEAERKAGPRQNPTERLDPCSYVRFATLPGIRFMVEDKVITRADAGDTVPNVLGIAVGAALADVRQAHPEAQIQPHKYEPDGHYVIFPSPDKTKAIILEATSTVITEIRAGLQPAVGYVEGCS